MSTATLRLVPVWVFAALAAIVWYYAATFDNTEFTSTQQLSYALSQSIQLYGPVVVGIGCQLALRQRVAPDVDIVASSPRGTVSFRRATIARAWVACAASYAAGVVLFSVTSIGAEVVANGVALRILLPVLATPLLLTAGYFVGVALPWRLAPALATVLAYPLVAWSDYSDARVAQLGLVQQARFTPWVAPDDGSSLLYLLWVLGLSGVALIVLVEAGLRRFAAALAAVVALTVPLISISADVWKPDQEFTGLQAPALRCFDAESLCLHPGYVSAADGLRPKLRTIDGHLDQVGLGTLRLEQTPYAFVRPRREGFTPIDVFSTLPADLDISLYESLQYALIRDCGQVRVHT